jgi:hypothetical protein
MKKENLAVLIQALGFAQTRANARPFVERKVFATPVAKSDDGKQEWTRFKSECVLLKRKEK